MTQPPTPADSPGSALSPAEEAHLESLNALLAKLQAAAADHSNSQPAREALMLQSFVISGQIHEVASGAYSRNTVALQAAAGAMDDPLAQLQVLKKQLASLSAKIQTAASIASAVDQAISTCESMLG